MLPDAIIKQAAAVVKLYRQKKHVLALAESCTGGLVAAAVTSIPGSSQVFESGYVTYANKAKVKELGIRPSLLRLHGAVSQECAAAMATAIRSKAGADIGLSITGIAGPTGGSEAKPVGLVYIGVASATATKVKRFRFKGDRDDIRQQAVREALALLLKA